VADDLAFQHDQDTNCGNRPCPVVKPERFAAAAQETLEVDHPKQIQYDEYDSDDDQGVKKAAGLGDRGIISRTEKTDQPQHDQNGDDNPQHVISPFRL